MKLRNLFFLMAFAATFAFTSCGDDDNGCTQCKLNVPILGDCEIDVCEDGSTTDNGATTCAGGIIVAASGTQAEKVAALEAAGFTCN